MLERLIQTGHDFDRRDQRQELASPVIVCGRPARQRTQRHGRTASIRLEHDHAPPARPVEQDPDRAFETQMPDLTVQELAARRLRL